MCVYVETIHLRLDRPLTRTLKVRLHTRQALENGKSVLIAWDRKGLSGENEAEALVTKN